MAGLVGEADELVLDGWAITRTDALDLAGIHGGLVEVVAHELAGFGGRVGHPARDLVGVGGPANAGFAGLFHVEQVFWVAVVVKREARRRGVAALFFHFGEVQGAAKKAWRSAGFEAAELDAGFEEAGGKGFGAIVP